MSGHSVLIGPGHLRLKYLRLYGEEPIIYEDTVWDDLRFPATAINPPGQVSDPDWDITIAGWLFAGGGTERLYLIAQLPHKWKEGTTLEPHIHWTKTTSAAGDVLWSLNYRWAAIGSVFDADWTTIQSSTVTVGTPDNDTADEHLITEIGNITSTGKGISDMLLMQLSRIGGSDSYGADARLLEFDIHYEIERPGSGDEFSNP